MSSLNFKNYASISTEMYGYLEKFGGITTSLDVVLDFLPNAYGGELLERYIEQDLINNNEKRLEIFMASAIAGLINNNMTIYANQLEVGLSNFKETSKLFPSNALMKVIIFIYEDYMHEKSSYLDVEPELVSLIKECTVEQLNILIEALSAFIINGKYDEPLTKTQTGPIASFGGIYLNIHQALDEEKFKGLKQSTRLITFIWAGINKKIMKLVKKDFKGNPFLEELTNASNGLLRDKSEFIRNKFLTEKESYMISYLGVKNEVLATFSSGARSHSSSYTERNIQNLEDFSIENDFFVNAYKNDNSYYIYVNEYNERLLHHFVYNMNSYSYDNKNDFSNIRYLNFRLKDKPEDMLKVQKFFYEKYILHIMNEITLENIREDDNDKDWLYDTYGIARLFDFFFDTVKGHLILSNEEVTELLEYLLLLDSFKSKSYYTSNLDRVFSKENLFDFISKGIVVLDKENVFLKERAIKQTFFKVISENLNYFIEHHYDKMKENFFNKYYLSKDFDMDYLLNYVKDKSEELINKYLMDYLDIIHQYESLSFIKTIEELYFKLVKRFNTIDTFKTIKQDLYQSLTYVKQEDENLISSDYRKYFAVTIKDIKNTINDIYISIYSSYKESIDKMYDGLTELFSLNELHQEEVQEAIYLKLKKDIFSNFTSSKNSFDNIVKFKRYLTILKQKDLLLESYINRFEKQYTTMIQNEALLKNLDVFEDIVAASQKTKEVVAN